VKSGKWKVESDKIQRIRYKSLVMKLLVIDTSTEACSAALSVNGELAECYEVVPRRHAELILRMVDKLLADAGISLNDLDVLGFGRGPGAFTGIRIAAGVIQGLAYATDLPVVPVSTLAALAQGSQHHTGNICSAIDARMGEIYWGLYQHNADNLVEPIQPESVSSPEKVVVPKGHRWYGMGSGWLTYTAVLEQKLGGQLIGFTGDCYPRAADMVPLVIHKFNHGKTVTPEQALPVYLRNHVVS
jgi:tRNA threonylcarbamoyladenosine biosynthesis protein TsaB